MRAFVLFGVLLVILCMKGSSALNCKDIDAAEFHSLMKAKFSGGITEKECQTIGGIKTHCSSSSGEDQCKKDGGANYKPVVKMTGKCSFSKTYCCLSV